eukprot:4315513-Pleurochrysis_carterae.AAC.1
MPALFFISADFFRIKLPTHGRKAPLKVGNGKITHVKKELLFNPGKTHVKEVCAKLDQAHKLQIIKQLPEADEDYCYISDGAASLQTEYLLAQL